LEKGDLEALEASAIWPPVLALAIVVGLFLIVFGAFAKDEPDAFGAGPPPTPHTRPVASPSKL